MGDQINASGAGAPSVVNPLVQVPAGETYTTLMVTHLKNTRPWVLFLAIMFIVTASVLVLAGLLMLVGSACIGMAGRSSSGAFSMESVGLGSTMTAVLGLFYLVLPVVYIPMIVFLFRYTRSVKALLADGKTVNLEKALEHQKSYWKYTGILAIVMLGIGVIAVIAVVLFGVLTAMNRMY